MKYQEFFDHYERIKEAKNKNIPTTKDYERIVDIYKYDENYEASLTKMAKLIKDKSKAIRRGIATTIIGSVFHKIPMNSNGIKKYWPTVDSYSREENAFYGKAKELGANLEEVLEAFEIARRSPMVSIYTADLNRYESEVEKETYQDDQGETKTKRSNSVWLGPLNKNLDKAGIPYKYSGSLHGFSKRKKSYTHSNYSKVKWIESTTLTLWPGTEKEISLYINIITDEAGRTTLFEVIDYESVSGKRISFEKNKSGYVGLSGIFKAIQAYSKKF